LRATPSQSLLWAALRNRLTQALPTLRTPGTRWSKTNACCLQTPVAVSSKVLSAAKSGESIIIGESISHYKILEKIGEGGMAQWAIQIFRILLVAVTFAPYLNPAFAQTTNDPFSTPIAAVEGVINVDFIEFASIPDMDGQAARLGVVLRNACSVVIKETEADLGVRISLLGPFSQA